MKNFIFTLLILLSSCSSPKERIIRGEWLYLEGYNIGDLIYFNEKQGFKIDDSLNIYVKNIHKATIKNISWDNELEIISKSGEIGFYKLIDDVY